LFFFPLPALWRTYAPNSNYGLLQSHAKAPILDLQWSLSSQILYTVAADHTLTLTDITTGERVRKIRAHREIINSVDRTMASGSGVELVVTGSDDGTVKIWEGGDEASKTPVATLEIGCPVTAVCWSVDGSNVYVGAIDNEIHVRVLSPLLSTVIEPHLLGLRHTQKRTSIHFDRTYRYPNFAFPFTERFISPLSFILLTNYCS